MSAAQDYSRVVNVRLWEHQHRMIEFARHRQGRCMFAAEMGTGKSLATIATIGLSGYRRVLIGCPLSVVGVWEREFAQYAQFPYQLARLDRGTVAEKQKQAAQAVAFADARNEHAIVVINHESLWREPFGDWALRAGFDCAVIDEAHRSKQHNGKLGRYVMQLGKVIPHRLALTGTPFAHSPLSIFAQFRFVDPSIFGWRYHPFKLRYAVMGGYQNRQVVRFQDLDTLHRKFYQAAIRITKEEALDLPEETHVERRCELPPSAAKLYRQLERDFYAQVEAGEVTASNALVKLLRLQQLACGQLTLDSGEMRWVSDHKKALLADLLQDLEPPVVVFARFTRDLETIQTVAEQAGLTYGEISGRRKDLTPQARMPTDIQVMGVNIQSGGVGIDLTRASTSLWYSLGFSLADFDQACARIHRPGQSRPVTHVHLLTTGTVDVQVRRALAVRRDVIRSVLEQRSYQAETAS